MRRLPKSSLRQMTETRGRPSNLWGVVSDGKAGASGGYYEIDAVGDVSPEHDLSLYLSNDI